MVNILEKWKPYHSPFPFSTPLSKSTHTTKIIQQRVRKQQQATAESSKKSPSHGTGVANLPGQPLPPMHPSRERDLRVHYRGRSPPGPRWPGNSCARCGAFLPFRRPSMPLGLGDTGRWSRAWGRGGKSLEPGGAAPEWVHKERRGVCRVRRVKTLLSRAGGGGGYVQIREEDSKEQLNPR